MPDALRCAWQSWPARSCPLPTVLHMPRQTFTCVHRIKLFGTVWTHIDFSRNITAMYIKGCLYSVLFGISPSSRYHFRNIVATKSTPHRWCGSPGQPPQTSCHIYSCHISANCMCVYLCIGTLWFLDFFFIFFFTFLGLHSEHMEVPKLGVQSELQLPAYTTSTPTQDLSHICNFHRSSQQCQILNPLSEARERTHVLMDPRWVCSPLGHERNS